MDILEELQELISTLRREAIPYALRGGMALAVHGIVRATEAIDLLVEEPALDRLRRVAERLGFRFDPNPFVFRDGDVKIYRLIKMAANDFLVLDVLVKSPLLQAAWDSQREVETAFGPMRVLSPAGLICLKRLRGSGQDKDDIRRLEELGDET